MAEEIEQAQQKARFSGQTLLRAFILLAFIIGSICLYHLTPVKEFFTPQVLDQCIKVFGLWAPFAFILIEAVSICLFVPASIPIVLGAGIFGAYTGFLYGWIGAIIGAVGAFFIGRSLGRDFVASLIGDKLKRYDDAIERNGFTTVLYLRLLNTPFTALNFGIGLTKVHFRDFFFGTALGVIVSIFAVTFLGGVLREVWASGRWGELVSPKVFFALALFAFSASIPIVIRKIRGQRVGEGH
ncbi:MAG: TVP38/TMEM64 family protein [Desulfatiglandaceae bacterium]